MSFKKIVISLKWSNRLGHSLVWSETQVHNSFNVDGLRAVFLKIINGLCHFNYSSFFWISDTFTWNKIQTVQRSMQWKYSMPLPRPRQQGPFPRGSCEACRDMGTSEHIVLPLLLSLLYLSSLCVHSWQCIVDTIRSVVSLFLSPPLHHTPSSVSLSPFNISGAHSISVYKELLRVLYSYEQFHCVNTL